MGKLRKIGRKVIGIDYDANAITLAKKKFPKTNFKIGDIRKWKPIESVDCVLIIDCLTEFTSKAVFNIIKHIKTYIKLNNKTNNIISKYRILFSILNILICIIVIFFMY